MTTLDHDFEGVDDPLKGENDTDVEPIPLNEIPVFEAAPVGVTGVGDGWMWHDTALIATEHVTPDGEGEEFAVALVDLYEHEESGEIGGRVLELGTTPDLENMAALYHRIEDAMDTAQTLPFERAAFAEKWLSEQGVTSPVWQDASAGEIAAYDAFAQAARDISNEETRPMPGVDDVRPADARIADSWDAFVTDHTPSSPDSSDDPFAKPHLWQMHTRPVESPEGLLLGTALVMTEYLDLPPDHVGDIPDDAAARTLEMAHFADENAARKFEAEFRTYLVPGLIDGPELAPEVAKLEGLSGEWGDMEGDTLHRDAAEVHLHDPNAEQEPENRFESSPYEIDF